MRVGAAAGGTVIMCDESDDAVIERAMQLRKLLLVLPLHVTTVTNGRPLVSANSKFSFNFEYCTKTV